MGSKSAASLTGSSSRDAGGNTEDASRLGSDLADAKRVEEAAPQESEERFRLVANVAPVMVWMSHVDKRCTYFNQRWLDFTGRSLDEEIGDRWAEGVHPDDLAHGMETYTNAFDRREAFQMEYRLRRHDGEYRWIVDTGVPRFNLDGVFAGYIGSCIDITEGRRVDEALRESEERFRRVFEEGPLGLAIVGRDYHFVKVNSALCRMVGHPEASLLQMTFADITYPDDLRTDVELAERLFRGEIPFYRLRKRYVNKNGGIIWINLTASLIRNQQGEPIYGLAMIEDITEVKRAQEIENRLASDLEHSRDEIRALAASLMRAQEDERRRVSRELHDHICHELGSLAVDIHKLTVGPLAPPKNGRAQLEAIRARVVKTSQEIHDIAYQMHTTILDDLGLVASLKDLCSQFSEHYPDIALDFENVGLPDSIPIEVASCLYRVAQESLQNIAKHSRAKCVSVRLDFQTGAVVLTIQDDGAGFDPKAVKGLGLISMKERAHSVNGKLTITAQLGHGAQIALEVPLPVGNL